MKVGQLVIASLLLALAATGCGGDDDDGSPDPAAGADITVEDPVDAMEDETPADGDAGSDDDPAAAGGGGSLLVLDGEEIELTSRGCFDREQEVAGFTFILTAQGHGTNAAGEQVTVDFSRASDGPSGAFDEVEVYIGEPGAGKDDNASFPEGTAATNGSVGMSDVTLTDVTER